MAKKWDGDTTSSEKLLLLFVTLLFNHRAFSLSELSSPSRLNASKPTVLRLLRQLEGSKIGVLIKERRGRESYYRLQHKTDTAVCLNPDAIANLALCRDFMLHLLPENLRKETAAVMAILQGKSTVAPAIVAGSLAKGRIDYDPFEEIFMTLQKAIVENLVCRAIYQAPRNAEQREHLIAPKRLLAYHETIYAECWLLDEENPARRKYDDCLLMALQRFKSCALTNFSSAALPPIDDDQNNYLGIVKDEPFRAKIRFAKDLAVYVSERIWSEGQKMEWLDDGSLLLTLMINNAEEGISWVLGFGEKAVALGPDWFVKDVRKSLRAALGNYAKMRK